MEYVAYRLNPENYYLQPCVFAATDTLMNRIKEYYLAEIPKIVFRVDITYKCVLFYVTPVAVKDPIFVKTMIP